MVPPRRPTIDRTGLLRDLRRRVSSVTQVNAHAGPVPLTTHLHVRVEATSQPSDDDGSVPPGRPPHPPPPRPPPRPQPCRSRSAPRTVAARRRRSRLPPSAA